MARLPDWVYFATGGGKCLVVTMRAYLDESDGQSIVAACLFSPYKAQKFVSDWRSGERDGLLDRVVGVVVVARPREGGRKGIAEIDAVCRRAVLACGNWCRTHRPTWKIRFMLEAGHPQQDRLQQLLGKVETDPRLKNGCRYSGHSIISKGGSSSEQILVQSANLLARLARCDQGGGPGNLTRRQWLLCSFELRGHCFPECGAGDSDSHGVKRHSFPRRVRLPFRQPRTHQAHGSEGIS